MNRSSAILTQLVIAAYAATSAADQHPDARDADDVGLVLRAHGPPESAGRVMNAAQS